MPIFFSREHRDELEERVPDDCIICGWLSDKGDCRLRKCTKGAA